MSLVLFQRFRKMRIGISVELFMILGRIFLLAVLFGSSLPLYCVRAVGFLFDSFLRRSFSRLRRSRGTFHFYLLMSFAGRTRSGSCQPREKPVGNWLGADRTSTRSWPIIARVVCERETRGLFTDARVSSSSYPWMHCAVRGFQCR